MPTKTFSKSISDDAIKKATKKTWKQWFIILDRAGAKSMIHREIAQLLYTKYHVPGWWSQMVTVGYEQARGLRKPGQKGTTFEISASKTIDSPALKIFHAWTNAATQKQWLKKNVVIRKATKPKKNLPRKGPGSASGGTIRLTWSENATLVDIGLYQKSPSKTQVSVQHSKLKNQSEVGRMKMWWQTALNRLQKITE